MTEKTLIQAIEQLTQSVDGLLLELKGMRTHGASAGDFLQAAIEDFQKVVREIKARIT